MYWDDKEKKEGNEYELTEREREINIDIQEGNLFIKGIFLFFFFAFTAFWYLNLFTVFVFFFI